MCTRNVKVITASQHLSTRPRSQTSLSLPPPAAPSPSAGNPAAAPNNDAAMTSSCSLVGRGATTLGGAPFALLSRGAEGEPWGRGQRTQAPTMAASTLGLNSASQGWFSAGNIEHRQMEGTKKEKSPRFQTCLPQGCGERLCRSEWRAGLAGLPLPGWSQTLREHLPGSLGRGGGGLGPGQTFLEWACPVYCKTVGIPEACPVKRPHMSPHALQGTQEPGAGTHHSSSLSLYSQRDIRRGSVTLPTVTLALVTGLGALSGFLAQLSLSDLG